MNYKLLYALALGLSSTMFFNGAVRADDPCKFNIEHPGHEVKVCIKGPESRVEVYVTNRKKVELPKSIGITLRNADGSERQLELMAIDPLTKLNGHYQGALSTGQESYVGVMIKIPFGKKKPVIMKSKAWTP